MRMQFTAPGILALLMLGTAIADEVRGVTYNLDIPAQSLNDSLQALAIASQHKLLYSSELVDGKSAPAVKGAYTAEQAIQQLLQGTQLAYEISDGLVLIRSQDSKDSTGDGHTSSTSPGAERAELEEIVVIGTLLRNTAPTSPVITLTREQIVRGGYTSTEAVLAQTPQNFNSVSAGTPLSTGGNLGWTTQVDLRGLGSEATLTLVNGRRISSAAGDEGRAVDISMIPVSAIERIDILTDGASALYGSDAIGGVVNIVLDKTFQGALTELQYGDNSNGADEILVSQMAGASSATGRILFTAQYSKSESLSYSDIGLGNIDFRARGGGDYRFEFLGAPGTVMPAGFFDGEPFATLTGSDDEPVFFAALPPGDGRSLDLSQLRLNEVTAIGDMFEHLLPQQESFSAYVTAEQEIGATTLFIDGAFAHRTSLFSQGNATDFLFVPATNAYSAFDEDVIVGYSFPDFGDVRFDVEKNGWFVNLGARGALGSGSWTWEAVGTQARDESETSLDDLDREELALRLASDDPALAFNPFGDGSGQAPGVIDAMRGQTVFAGRTTLRSVAVQAQGSLWQLPGGVVRLALGSEYREEEMHSSARPTGAGEIDLYPGATRDVGALFGELYVPLVGEGSERGGPQQLALSAAARYEDYSDFGDTINPKLGILWRPIPGLALKANWGTSFRAPSLRELTFLSFVSSDLFVLDPNAPGGPAEVFADVIEGGNRDLREETAKTYTISAEYTPTWLEGLRFSLTRFHIDYEDRIRGSLDGIDVNTLLHFESVLPAGTIVRAPDGTLEVINVTNINSAHTIMSGYDAAAGHYWSTQRWGSFDLSASTTFISRYDDQLIGGSRVLDFAGRVGSTPDWRGSIGLVWSSGPWSTAVFVHHTDGLRNEDIDPRIVRRTVASQTTTDLQLSYTPRSGGSWLHGFTARLGATNLFDERPPFVDGPQRFGLDIQNSSVRGRTMYLRLSKGFGAAGLQ